MNSRTPTLHSRSSATNAKFTCAGTSEKSPELEQGWGAPSFAFSSRVVTQSGGPQVKDEWPHRFPKFNWDGITPESWVTGVSPHGSRMPYFSELEPLYLGRRHSNAPIVSATSSLSTTSVTLFENTSSFYRKRQRESDDVLDHCSRLAPTLRSKSDKSSSRVRLETDDHSAGPRSPAGLETLIYRFLTHTMSSHTLSGGPHLPDKQIPFRFGPTPCADWTFAAASDETADDVVRPSTTDSLSKNTLPAQQVTLDLLPISVPHVSRSEFGARRSATLLSPTDHPEHAYTQIAREDCLRHNESPEQTTPLLHLGTSRHGPLKSLPNPFSHLHPYPSSGNEFSDSINHLSAPSIDSSGTINRTSSADRLLSSQSAGMVEPPFARIFSAPSNTLGLICTVIPRGTVLTEANQIKHDWLPSRHEFSGAIEAYLSALSSKKLPKALITEELYNDIVFTLKREKDDVAGIRTPQFRFWCRKHFALSTVPRLRPREQSELPHLLVALPIGNQDDGKSDEVEVVTHGGQPVVTKEMIYDVLAQCHLLANHAGRDKTTAIVRKNYSWVPKVLIGDFIKLCPVCHSKKAAGMAWTHAPIFESNVSRTDSRG